MDTRRGAVLTSNNALTADQEKANADRVHRDAGERRAIAKERSETLAIRRAERARWIVRTQLAIKSNPRERDVAEFRARVRPKEIVLW